MIKNLFTNTHTHKGFTLVELIVSVAIFAIMTALVMAKYGTFNQGILLTNLAYDIALTLRTAQSYGLNVKSAPDSNNYYSEEFNFPYGVHFDANKNTSIIFFADQNGNLKYDSGDTDISVYNIKRGSYISSLCTGSDPTSCPGSPQNLDIVFKRPDPKANFNASGGTSYAEIRLRSSDGGTKKIIVNRAGQIAVSN